MRELQLQSFTIMLHNKINVIKGKYKNIDSIMFDNIKEEKKSERERLKCDKKNEKKHYDFFVCFMKHKEEKKMIFFYT